MSSAGDTAQQRLGRARRQRSGRLGCLLLLRPNDRREDWRSSDCRSRSPDDWSFGNRGAIGTDAVRVPHPTFTGFVVEDGGTETGFNKSSQHCLTDGDPAGIVYPVTGNLYRGIGRGRRRLGAVGPILGLPISGPFRVGSELCHAFEFGILHWRSDLAAAEQIDVLDIGSDTGADPGASAHRRTTEPGAEPQLVDQLSTHRGLSSKVVHWLQPSGRHRGRDHLSQIRTSVL